MTRSPQYPQVGSISNVAEAAKVIRYALKNVGNICIDLLMLALRRFVVEWDDARLVTHRSVFIEIMVFISAYRTDEDIAALRAALSEPLDCGNPRAAAPPRLICNRVHGSRPNPVADLIDQLCCVLNQAFVTRRAQLERVWKASASRRKWPQSTAQLLPGDPATAVHMLGKWLQILDAGDGYMPESLRVFDNELQILLAGDGFTPGPVRVLNSLLCALHAYALPGLLTTPALGDWLHGTLTRLSVTPYIRVLSVTGSVFFFAAELLRQATDDMFDDELTLWLARSAHGVDGMAAVFHACLVAMDGWPATMQNTRGARSLDVPLAVALCRLRPLAPFNGAWQGPPLPHRLDVMAARLMGEQDDPVVQLFHLVSHSAWTHRCHGPACTNSRSSAGTHTRQCRQCRRATYCSRACQRAAWEHPNASHRDVCNVLRVLDENKEESEREIFGIMRDKISWDELHRALDSVRSLRVTQFERLQLEVDGTDFA